MKASELLMESQYLSESRERQIISEAKALAEAINGADVANIFQNVEKSMSDAGQNRTLLGKGKDAASYVNQTLNKMGKWLSTTTPVKGFDQKFEQLKAKISTNNPNLTSALTSIGGFGKKNPAVTAAIIGLLTTTAAVAAGPAGGLIAGQLLRGGMELMKGEKLSTAVGKGMKTAALGYGIGQIADMVKDFMPSAAQPQVSSGGTDGGSVGYIPPETIDGGMWDGVTKEIKDNILAKYPESQGYTFNNDGMNLLVYDAQGGKQAMISYDAMYDHARQMASGQMADSVILTTAQVNQLFEHIQNEGIGDYIKGKWNAAKQGVAQVGKNITTKFTADKMLSAWKKAGAPEDAGAIINVLKQMGIPKDRIQGAFQAVNKLQDYEAGVAGNEKSFDNAQAEMGQAADAIKFGKVPSDAELLKMVAKAKAPNAPKNFIEMVRQLLVRRKELMAKQAQKDRVAQAKQAQKQIQQQAQQPA